MIPDRRSPAGNRQQAASRWGICFAAALALHAAALFGLIGYFEVQPSFGMSAGAPAMEVGLVEPAAEPEIAAPAPIEEPPAESEFKTVLPEKNIPKKERRPAPKPPGSSSESPAEAQTDDAPLAPRGATQAMADYLSNPPPSYPAISRRLGEEGTVLLTVNLTATGRVDEVRVKLPSGFERLDQAALNAVRTWRFKPAMFGGVPIAGAVDVPIRFNLR